MRTYLNPAQSLATEENVYKTKGYHNTFEDIGKTVKHHGKKYVKVSELTLDPTKKEKSLLRFKSCLAAIFSMGLALFSRDIRKGLQGKRVMSIYSESNGPKPPALMPPASVAKVASGALPAAAASKAASDNQGASPAAALRAASDNQGASPVAAAAPIVVKNPAEEFIKYQTYLNDLIKVAYEDLSGQDKLVELLERDLESGKERLDDQSATLEFANYVQLKEIEDDKIGCPKEFSQEAFKKIKGTTGIQTRYELIQDIKKRLKDLTEDSLKMDNPEHKSINERDILIEMLLKADGNVGDKKLTQGRIPFIKDLFKDITALSNQLHHGELLTETKDNKPQNRFGFIYQEAIDANS